MRIAYIEFTDKEMEYIGTFLLGLVLGAGIMFMVFAFNQIRLGDCL